MHWSCPHSRKLWHNVGFLGPSQNSTCHTYWVIVTKLRSWMISLCFLTLQHKLRNLRRQNNLRILSNKYLLRPSRETLPHKNIQLPWAPQVHFTLWVHRKSNNPPWQLIGQVNQGVNYTDHFPDSHGHKGYRWPHIYAAIVKNSTAEFISVNSFDCMCNRCAKGLHKTLSLLVQIFWLLKSFQRLKEKYTLCNHKCVH